MRACTPTCGTLAAELRRESEGTRLRGACQWRLTCLSFRQPIPCSCLSSAVKLSRSLSLWSVRGLAAKASSSVDWRLATGASWKHRWRATLGSAGPGLQPHAKGEAESTAGAPDLICAENEHVGPVWNGEAVPSTCSCNA